MSIKKILEFFLELLEELIELFVLSRIRLYIVLGIWGFVVLKKVGELVLTKLCFK